MEVQTAVGLFESGSRRRICGFEEATLHSRKREERNALVSSIIDHHPHRCKRRHKVQTKRCGATDGSHQLKFCPCLSDGMNVCSTECYSTSTTLAKKLINWVNVEYNGYGPK